MTGTDHFSQQGSRTIFVFTKLFVNPFHNFKEGIYANQIRQGKARCIANYDNLLRVARTPPELMRKAG